MKKYLNKISVHPFFIILAFIFILLGKFRFILYYTLLVLIHELGHLITAIIFKWDIDKILILPFGCLIKFNMPINTSLKEEFIISINGVLIQFIFFLLTNSFIDYKYYSLINYFIIIFNLLPIYPLDGSKIINVILNYISSFYNSLNITIIISYIFIFISLYTIKLNKLSMFIIYLLFMEVKKLNKNKKNIFNKFLLERYLYKYNFKKEKIINNIKKMKKEYRHIFYIDKHYETEYKILKKMFDFKRNM